MQQTFCFGTNLFFRKLRNPDLLPHGWVPATVVLVPQTQVPHGGAGEEHVVSRVGAVKGVLKICLVAQDERPQGDGLGLHLLLDSFTFAVRNNRMTQAHYHSRVALW